MLSASGIGDGLIGAPDSGSDGLTGTSRLSVLTSDDLGRLDGQHGVRAVAAGGDEQVVQVLHGRLRVERHDRVLELLGADRPRPGCASTSTSESPTENSPRQTSTRSASAAGRPPPDSCSGISSRAERTR